MDEPAPAAPTVLTMVLSFVRSRKWMAAPLYLAFAWVCHKTELGFNDVDLERGFYLLIAAVSAEGAKDALAYFQKPKV